MQLSTAIPIVIAAIVIVIKSRGMPISPIIPSIAKQAIIFGEIVIAAILKDLKIEITDLWKEQNVINLLMPLSINLKFQHSKLEDLDKLRSILYKISIIQNYKLEEFNIKNSSFKIYYYGNPKKLRSELSKFGYLLMNNQGVWHLILNE